MRNAQEDRARIERHGHRVTIAFELGLRPEILTDLAALSHGPEPACVGAHGQLYNLGPRPIPRAPRVPRAGSVALGAALTAAAPDLDAELRWHPVDANWRERNYSDVRSSVMSPENLRDRAPMALERK